MIDTTLLSILAFVVLSFLRFGVPLLVVLLLGTLVQRAQLALG
jgi:hypothetical protein